MTISSVRAVIIYALLAGTAGAADELASSARLTTTVAPAAALTTVVIDGSSVYDAPRLFGAYRAQLGKPITRESARAVVDALAGLYAADGYVQPEIRLDDALVANGVLRARLAEAQVTNVVFDGDMGGYRDALERIATKLEAAKPLRRNDIPDALRDMRAIAGLAVTATSRRDPVAPNAYELVVKTKFTPVDGMVRMTNRGTHEAGPNFLLGQVFANGLLGHEEKLGLIFAAATDPREFLGAGLYVDTPFGARGAHANSLLFRSRSAPNET